MSETLTIPGPLLQFRARQALTPGMHGLVLRIGDEIDRMRIREDVRDAVWLSLPAALVRGERSDNHWLREWLQRLLGVELAGEYRGNPWGAVLVAEWHIEDGGSLVRVLVPPAAVNALRAPATFTKVEADCLVNLRGAARELYLALSDKKRLDRQHWEFDLVELRSLLGVGDKKAYARWDDFSRWVLAPAVQRINDFGTVHVTMTPQRIGRSIRSVRFDWRWKTLDEARETAEEVERPRIARGKPREGERVAPPLIVPEDEQPARPSVEERRAHLDKIGARDFVRDGS